MTDCDKAVAQLYSYLDGELDQVNATEVRLHLEACSDCFGAFDFERRILTRIRRINAEPMPPELIDRIRTFLTKHATGDPQV